MPATRQNHEPYCAAPAQGGADPLWFVEDRRGAGSDGEEEAAGSQGSEEDEEEGGAAGPGPSSSRQQGQQARRRKAAAWQDEADAELSVAVADSARLRKLRQSKGQEVLEGEAYTAALRKQHQSINPRTSWAALPTKPQQQEKQQRQGGGGVAAGYEVNEQPPEEPEEEQEEGEDGGALEAQLRQAGGLLAPRGRGAHIAGGAIEMSRLRDANQHAPSAAVLQTLSFHPGGQVLLTGGFDKKLRLFAVDGLRNPLLQAVHLADLPVHAAAWAGGGSAAVATGRRPFYCMYDLALNAVERCAAPASALSEPPKSLERFAASPDEANPLLAFLLNGGHVALASLRSRQAVGSLKMNGSARVAVFNDDGSQLITSGAALIVWRARCNAYGLCVHCV